MPSGDPPRRSDVHPSRRHRLKRTVLATLLLGVLACGAGYAALRLWPVALDRPGPLPEAKAFVIPHGNTDQVAQALAADNVLDRTWDQTWLFRIAAWVTHRQGPLHAAEFEFPAHASVRQVLAILRTARPVEHRLTIPEGLTAQQITAILAHAEAATGPVPPFAEGSILPQTYDYEYDTARAHLLTRAREAMAKALAIAWANRAPNLPFASPQDALILASIVERETARPDERPHVAAVYLNRLRRGMRLQADPTVAYAVSNGSGTLDRPLTRSDLDSASPFNTYRNAGLPPAPICAPGLDSLAAVLHPATSDDLYFVADGTGGHIFSRTYEAQAAAVARWRTLSTAHPKAD